MGPYRSSSYSSYAPYVHTWPGKAKVSTSCKHATARKARAASRHA